MKLTIGTRASSLAVAQTKILVQQLKDSNPGLEIELKKIRTTGDRILDRPLADIGGKGLFVKEIEHAMLEGAIDCAVHSLKDMPVEPPEDLELVSFPEREVPFDVLCNRGPKALSVMDLPNRARIGTGSLRRGNQLMMARPDLDIVPLRGSIETRLAKRIDMDLDAVVLAESGLRRASIWEDGFHRIDPKICVPAPGQGTLCIQARAGDRRTIDCVRTIHSKTTFSAITAERACLAAIGGDCHTPFAAWADLSEEGIRLSARLFHDGRCAERTEFVEWTTLSPEDDARELGTSVGRELISELGIELPELG